MLDYIAISGNISLYVNVLDTGPRAIISAGRRLPGALPAPRTPWTKARLRPEDLTGKRALKCADGASGVLRGPALRVTWRNG